MFTVDGAKIDMNMNEQHSVSQKTNFEKVQEFHSVFASEQHGELGKVPPQKTLELRERLITEEFGEYLEAVEERDIIKVADAIGDLLVVVYGTGDAWGIPVDLIFEEIHRSNMSKRSSDGQVIRDEGGKVLKGDRYSPPKLVDILLDHMAQ
jgi:predicted HAD superfamily Cof-like phosphohydrolase